MDFNIRQQLTFAEKNKDTGALRTAYNLIKAGAEERDAADATGRFSTDLFVICAEQAFQLGVTEISKDCLEMYFKEKCPANQFLGRAYLCQAQLNAPGSAENRDELETASAYFIKAIDFAKHHPRYHFLIFNTSVLYWQMSRPFSMPGSRKFLIPSLTHVLNALEEIGESDFHWRATLMLELLESLLDAGHFKDAAKFANEAALFIKTNVPHLYQKIFSLQMQHKLIDAQTATKAGKNFRAISVIYKIQMLKSEMNSKEFVKDAEGKLSKILRLLQSNAREVSTESSDEALEISTAEKISLLLQLAHIALELNSPQVTAACLSNVEKIGLIDSRQLIEVQCLKIQVDLKKDGIKIEKYSKAAVEMQLKATEQLDLVLQNAVREGDLNVIQIVCVAQWNLCLPLLQHNIKRRVKKQLNRVAEALEKSNSLMFQLHCQIHIEIGRIEENEDRIEAAIQHFQKALNLDDRGVYKESLQATLHLLQLQTVLYKTPDRPQDIAAKIIEQAKKGKTNDDVRMKRSLLENAGIALSPKTFLVVLDGEHDVKDAALKKNNKIISQLAAKAQHHTDSLQELEGYLSILGSHNDKERMKLWAALAKVARKQEVWDICRVACRFCLLYDDGRWQASNEKKDQSKSEGNLDNFQHSMKHEKELLRLLAEVRFISAEATVHKLQSEGVQLNDKPVPPEDKRKHSVGFVMTNPANDPMWIVYRDWISRLSDYATENFLRAAELGVELNEAWIVCNAAVYIWNYNIHLIKSGRQRELVETFQKILSAFKKTGHCGETVLVMMLCNVVAQGLMAPWLPHTSKESFESREHEKRSSGKTSAEKSSKSSTRSNEKIGSNQGFSVDPSGQSDLKKALEVCEFALGIANGIASPDSVPVAVVKQIVMTWVKIKQLLQQNIVLKLESDDESKDISQSAMTKILTGLEMHSCNNTKLMEFSAPSLSLMAKVMSDCTWTDAVVELQAWIQLAHFSLLSNDHDLVMLCTQKAKGLEEAATKKVNLNKLTICDYSVVQEMFSIIFCTQGQSIFQSSAGNRNLLNAALNAFELSACYAEKAGNNRLAMTAARHFWNACLPIMHLPSERQLLRDSIVKILKAVNCTSQKEHLDEGELLTVVPRPSSELSATPVFRQTGPSVTSIGNPEEDLTLRTAMYALLFFTYADNNDWEAGLNVLDEAIWQMPRTKHRLFLFKHRAIVKARLGQNTMMDMQKLRNETEDYISYMWSRLADCSKETADKLSCYQNAIGSLKQSEYDWQKVEFLLLFGEWLYSNQFPVSNSLNIIEWAIDVLLHLRPGEQEKNNDDTEIAKPRTSSKLPSKKETNESNENSNSTKPLKKIDYDIATPDNLGIEIGVQVTTTNLSLSDLKNIKQLETLIRAHTLLAIILGSGSSQHQQNCLIAYAYVMRIWQVSLASGGVLVKELMKNQSAPSPATPAATPKSKQKGKKSKEPPTPVVKEKPKRKGPLDVLPATPEEWAGYDCPDEIREVFKHDGNVSTINNKTITKPMQSLYYLDQLVKELQLLSLIHLTLPVLQFAEVIAHEVMGSKSRSDLYHLRIAQVSTDLGLNMHAAYHEKIVGTIFIYDEEQIKCRQDIFVQKEQQTQTPKEKSQNTDAENISLKMNDKNVTGKGMSDICIQDLWMDKAELLLKSSSYQPARLLLSEAYMASTELGDKAAKARCLYLFAFLANSEKKHAQAKAFLEKAREIGGDEYFWFNTTHCLVTAIAEGYNENKEILACKVLEHTVSILKSALEERPNRAPICRFMVASLEARKASLQLQLFLHKLPEKNINPHSLEKIMAACDRLSQSSKELIQCGHKKEGVDAIVEQAMALRKLASKTDNEEFKHHYLLESYRLMNHAVMVQEEVFCNTVNIFNLQETRNLSLPVTRKLAKIKLMLVDLTIDMLQILFNEEKMQAFADEQKGPVRKMVEEYVRNTPDCTSVEQEWIMTGKTLGQMTLTQLESVYTLCTSSLEMKVKCLCLLGKCLRLLSVKNDPIYPLAHWNSHFVEEIKSKLNDDEPEIEADCQQQEVKQYSSKASKLKNERLFAQQTLAQATEVLAQTLSLSINNKFTDVITMSSLDLLECFQQFDHVSSCQYLALYQSCRVSMMMSEVLNIATSDTSSSQLAALMNLLNQLHGTRDARANTLFLTVQQKLTEISKAYANLMINPQHLNHLNDLPPNFRILILQHSEDRSVLYGAFFDKAKANEKLRGPPLTGPLMHTRVARTSVNPDTFSKLLAEVRQYKQNVMKLLLKKEFQKSYNLEQTYEVLNEDPSDFNHVVKLMKDYLRPILSQFDFSVLRTQTSLLSTKEKEEKPASGKTTSSATVDTEESIIVLADKLLMELPLEALKIIDDDGLSTISRDFSLQLLWNRMQREEPVKSEGKHESKSAKQAKVKGDQKKSIKAVPISRDLPANCTPVNTHNFKYVVDPYNEVKEPDSVNPVNKMKQILETYSPQFTPQWQGIMGNEHVPSHAELEQLLNKSSAFVFYGTERFLANLMPSRLVAMNVAECQIVILFDLVQSSRTFFRQSKLDENKSLLQLSLEDPINAVILLSLTGVSSVMANQWHTTLIENAKRADIVFENLLKLGHTTGQTVQAMQKQSALLGTSDNSGSNNQGHLIVMDTEQRSKQMNDDDQAQEGLLLPSDFNCVLYGLPNLVVM
ncbi:cilia- and flagella-associated protein 46 [Polypterus senegalus]|uniref:cilia- and flagella-associated protein 46 n=1 Tax=Polypterus senegalus TaxID=55291 RepID=UPI0019652D48|nr:cilia- and flagella-associated protein 46 [Polypterus senegalus]